MGYQGYSRMNDCNEIIFSRILECFKFVKLKNKLFQTMNGTIEFKNNKLKIDGNPKENIINNLMRICEYHGVLRHLRNQAYIKFAFLNMKDDIIAKLNEKDFKYFNYEEMSPRIFNREIKKSTAEKELYKIMSFNNPNFKHGSLSLKIENDAIIEMKINNNTFKGGGLDLWLTSYFISFKYDFIFRYFSKDMNNILEFANKTWVENTYFLSEEESIIKDILE